MLVRNSQWESTGPKQSHEDQSWSKTPSLRCDTGAADNRTLGAEGLRRPFAGSALRLRHGVGKSNHNGRKLGTCQRIQCGSINNVDEFAMTCVASMADNVGWNGDDAEASLVRPRESSGRSVRG
jgi:hypothetical protein